MATQSRHQVARRAGSIGAVLTFALVTLPFVGVPNAHAAPDLLSNGDFEQSGGSLTGWSVVKGTLALASDGFLGGHAGAISYSGIGGTYSIKSGPQGISAMVGTTYTADALVRADTPGRSVCLKIVESGTIRGSAIKCSNAASSWAGLPEVTYTAQASGDKLVVWVIQKSAASGDSFEVDNISLSTPASPPGAPANLHTTAVLPSEVDLAWDASSTAGVTYTLYRGPDCSSQSQLATGLGTTIYPDTSAQPSTAYAYTVDAFDGTTHSLASNCLPVSTPASPPVIAAVGDIACDPADPNFNGGNGQNQKCGEASTAALVSAGSSPGHPYSAVLPLGDLQYDCGSLARFYASYDPVWGLFSASAYPVSGNHEYNSPGIVDPGCDTSATAYYQYFADYNNPNAAGVNGQGYYSFNLGTWHVIALNSNCANLPFSGTQRDGCAVGSPQETWLVNDLNANPSTCTLAFWHHAPWSSKGNNQGVGPMRPMWADLANAGADLALVGHFHHYERFANMNAGGVAVPNGTGMREIVVGTGGEGLGGFNATPLPASQVRDSSTFGIISVTLGAGSYSWNFIPSPPGTFTDSGTDTCH